MVLNIASRILGNTELAQDVHQDVFLAIWRRWSKFDGRTNWDGYFYRVTARKALALARRARLTVGKSLSSTDAVTDNEPDEAMRIKELQQELAGALARLPKRQADVFVLSRIEGLNSEKIAEIIGCSQKTVRVHLHRATKRLAHDLDDYLK